MLDTTIAANLGVGLRQFREPSPSRHAQTWKKRIHVSGGVREAMDWGSGG